MATIPREYIDNYTKALNKLSADVQARLAKDLAKIDYTGDIATIREAVIELMERYLGAYTDMAAVVAAEFYDGVREHAVGASLGAAAESTRRPAATAGAVRACIEVIVEGGASETFIKRLTDRADYEIKKAAGDCVYYNGIKDPLKPKYARVPSGTETCKFCIMLASRGYVYHAKTSAGEDGHYHSGCDCRIVPSFGGEKVEGYEPKVYKEQYKAMLEGHELEQHYDLLTVRGKTTKRMYQTRAYDYNAALGIGKKSGRSAKYAAFDGELDFKSFSDVKAYIYEAKDKADLESRYSKLGRLYGFRSEQMQSDSMKNAFRHMEKQFDKAWFKDDGTAIIVGKQRIPYGARAGFTGISRERAIEEAKRHARTGDKNFK